MPATTAQQAYNEITAHIQKEGSAFYHWYCGITNNIERRLHQEHKVPKKEHWFARQECYSSADARKVEEALLAKGCKGGTGGGDTDAVFVYAYKITSSTVE